MKRYEVGNHHVKLIFDNFLKAHLTYSILGTESKKYLVERKNHHRQEDDRILFNTFGWQNTFLNIEEEQDLELLNQFKNDISSR